MACRCGDDRTVYSLLGDNAIAAQFFAFCVPAAVYGYVNNPSDGIGYAMLPVRVWVKFAAMMLVSVIVIPLTFYIGIYVLDCLLTAVGGGRGFSGMVWSTESGISPGGFWYDFGKICLYQSVFVLGNLVLRKHSCTACASECFT